MRILKLITLLLIVVSFTVFADDQPLSFKYRFTECLNHWVTFKPDNGNNEYQASFMYIDIEAGPTLHLGGRFKIDESGRFIKIEDDVIDKQAMLKVRLDHNGGTAAIIPPDALIQLGLPEKPFWLKFYEDESNSPHYRTRMGYWLNDLGDSNTALTYLESAYKEAPETEDLAFELAFAYNALQKPEKAIPVLETALKREPDNLLLGKELAVARMLKKEYKEVVKLYRHLLSICPDGDIQTKTEFTFNLAIAYIQLDMGDEYKKLVDDAKAWIPKDSPVYPYLYEYSQD